MRNRLLAALAGLVVGCGATLAVLLATGNEESGEAAGATTAPTTTAPVWWVDPREVALGPSVLVVEGLTVEDGEAVLSYQLHDLVPLGPGRLVEPDDFSRPGLERLADEAAVAPQLWTLITASGEIPGTSASTRSRTARFPLPDGTLPEVLGLRLDRYWMRVGYTYQFDLPATATVGLDEGYAVTVSRVLEQTGSTIVQLSLTPPSGFNAGDDPGALLLYPLGAGWGTYSGPTTTGLQFVYGEGPLPDPIRFEATSAYWVPFDRPLEIDLGDSASG